MKEIIKSMIEQAEAEENYSLMENIKQLIDKFSETINCPSNWRSIGEELAKEYGNEYRNGWIYEELQLWNYEEE